MASKPAPPNQPRRDFNSLARHFKPDTRRRAVPPNRLHDLCDAACENCFEHPTDGNWVAWRWRLDEIFGPYFHSKVWFYAEISNEELVKLEKLAGPYGKVFYKVYLLNEGSEQRQRRK